MMAITIITRSPVPYIIIIIILKAVGWVVIEVRCYFLYFLAEALSLCQPRECAGQTLLVIIIVIIVIIIITYAHHHIIIIINIQYHSHHHQYYVPPLCALCGQ